MCRAIPGCCLKDTYPLRAVYALEQHHSVWQLDHPFTTPHMCCVAMNGCGTGTCCLAACCVCCAGQNIVDMPPHDFRQSCAARAADHRKPAPLQKQDCEDHSSSCQCGQAKSAVVAVAGSAAFQEGIGSYALPSQQVDAKKVAAIVDGIVRTHLCHAQPCATGSPGQHPSDSFFCPSAWRASSDGEDSVCFGGSRPCQHSVSVRLKVEGAASFKRLSTADLKQPSPKRARVSAELKQTDAGKNGDGGTCEAAVMPVCTHKHIHGLRLCCVNHVCIKTLPITPHQVAAQHLT